MSPKVSTYSLANFLYSRRFAPYFIHPVIVGLSDENQPFVATMDSIGAIDIISEGFISIGTTNNEIIGIAEALWREHMDSQELFQVASQILISATNRDCLAGWGLEIIIIQSNCVIERILKSRQD